MNNSTTECNTIKLITLFHSESTAHSNDINISYYEKYSKLVKMTWHFVKILPFLQCARNSKQFISIDSPSLAEQNNTNDFIVACTVVEILYK